VSSDAHRSTAHKVWPQLQECSHSSRRYARLCGCPLTTYNNTDEEEDEEPEVFAPVPRLRSGFSTASSAGVWETWPVRAPPDCGGGSQAKMRRSGIHIVEPAQARQRLAEATDETTYNNTGEKRTR
jgi:hypothetical protein